MNFFMYLFVLLNFFLHVLVSSFSTGTESTPFHFLRSPYNLSFGEYAESGVVHDYKDKLKKYEENEEIKKDSLEDGIKTEHESANLNNEELKDIETIKVIYDSDELSDDNIVNDEEDDYIIESQSDTEDDDSTEYELKGNTKKDTHSITYDNKNNSDQNYPPVILVPGLGGSSLIAEYRDAHIPTCGPYTLSKRPFRIWLSLARLLSIKSNLYCTFDSLRLKYNNETQKYSNYEGVIIRTDKYGTLKGVDYLDYIKNTPIGFTGYYSSISKYFIKNGYEEGESIFGAPYDWRYPLIQQNYELLKEHIEYIYLKRNGNKVNLVGHSFGGLFINYFLSNIVDYEWKKKYINSVVYIAVPFKGSIKSIRALLHGDGNSVSFSLFKLIKLSVSDGMLKALGKSFGSIIDLIPYHKYYNKDKIVIIVNIDDKPVPKKKMQEIVLFCGLYDTNCYTSRSDVKLEVYTLSNWITLLSPDLKIRYENNLKHIDREYSMDHGVPIYCIYSVQKNKKTEHLLFFQSKYFNSKPILYEGRGDGTVPLDSLEGCKKFHNLKKFIVANNVKHSEILHHDKVIQKIYEFTRYNVEQ